MDKGSPRPYKVTLKMNEPGKFVSIRNVYTRKYLTADGNKLRHSPEPYGWHAIYDSINEGIAAYFWVVLDDTEYYLQPADEPVDENSVPATIGLEPIELFLSDAGYSDGSFNITDPFILLDLAIAKDHETPMESIKHPAHKFELSFREDLVHAGIDNRKFRWVIEPFKE